MKMTRASIFAGVLSVFVCFGSLTRAQQEVYYPVYRMTTPIQLDGRLDEQGWLGLIEATNFKILSQHKLTDKQTYFRFGWDDEYLYVGVKCEEPDIAKVKAVVPDRGYVFSDDSIEIFLAPKKLYYHLGVNTIGSRRWSGDEYNLEAQAIQGKDFWASCGLQ